MSVKTKASPESLVREIKRKTRRKFTAEEKIRIVLERLRGEESITDLCRRQGIHPTMYYKWSKAFLEAGRVKSAEEAAKKGTLMVNGWIVYQATC